MCEVTRQNFREKWPQIKASLQKSSIISIDLEFSGLEPLKNNQTSLFDTNAERYAKLAKNADVILPLQVGLTAFRYDQPANAYLGEVFTFHLCPPSFPGLPTPTLRLAPPALLFLTAHGFDFNRCLYTGLPFLRRGAPARLRALLPALEPDALALARLAARLRPAIARWLPTAPVGARLELAELRPLGDRALRYALHRRLRALFHPLVWTRDAAAGEFVVQRVAPGELPALRAACPLADALVFDLTGFAHVFELLAALRKPLVGHNLFNDLLIMVNTFAAALPASYARFKAAAHALFPTIFDTKTLYYEVRSSIPLESRPTDTSLEALFEYFKDGPGRHLAGTRAVIEGDFDAQLVGKYHDAAWDSFCTGYIFLRMSLLICTKFNPKKNEFLCSELVNRVEFAKNRVNLIKGSTNHIRLDGNDEDSMRPPWLIVQSLKNEPLDLYDLTSSLSCYGTADVRKLSRNGHRVLVAMDTHRAVREFTQKSQQKFQIRQYNVWRHSKTGQALILTATISSGLLLWFTTRQIIRK